MMLGGFCLRLFRRTAIRSPSRLTAVPASSGGVSQVGPGELVDLGRIEVEPGAVVRLRAVDLKSRAPVEGAIVCLEERSAEISRDEAPSQTTDESGRAEIGGLIEGVHPFSVTSLRHAPATVDLEARIDPGEDQEVLLSAGGKIAGSVLRGGAPAEGDRIEVALRTGQRAAVVDREGRYAMERLPPGRAAVQRLGRDGEVEMRHAEVRDGETAVVDFGVGTTLSGNVRRAGGPVPAAGVVLFQIVDWDAGGDGGSRREGIGRRYQRPIFRGVLGRDRTRRRVRLRRARARSLLVDCRSGPVPSNPTRGRSPE